MRFPILPDSPSPTDGQTLVYDDVSKRWVPATASGGGSGTSDHAALTNRDAADQHPIGAVTGLQSALDGKADATHTHGAADLSGVVKTVNGEAPDEAGNVVVEGGGTTPAFIAPRLGGKFYNIAAGQSVNNGMPVVPQRLYLMPLVLMAEETYTAMGITTNAADPGGLLRFGVYHQSRGPSPMQLIVETTPSDFVVANDFIHTFPAPFTPDVSDVYYLAMLATGGSGIGTARFYSASSMANVKTAAYGLVSIGSNTPGYSMSDPHRHIDLPDATGLPDTVDFWSSLAGHGRNIDMLAYAIRSSW